MSSEKEIIDSSTRQKDTTVPSWWTPTIIRDYAYPKTDPRFHGNTTTAAQKESVSHQTNDNTKKGTASFSDDEQSEDHADGATEQLFESDEEEDIVDSDEDESDDDGEIPWAWQWTYKQRIPSSKPLPPPDGMESEQPSESSVSSQNISSKENTLPLVRFKDFDNIVIAKLKDTIAHELKLCDDISDEDKMNMRMYRAKTIFPFGKATDYEMSLETGDEVIVITLESKSNSEKDESDTKKDIPESGEKSVSKSSERWVSIDELDDIDDTRVSLNVTDLALASPTEPNVSESENRLKIELDPPVDRFVLEVVQFLGFNKTYGSSWVTALKVKAKGTSFDASTTSQPLFKIKLRDLGLIPGNYIEPQ